MARYFAFFTLACVACTSPGGRGESDADVTTPTGAAVGEPCQTGPDCASNVCGASFVCVRAQCGDGAMNLGELGNDCGGPCPACDGATCGTDADCASARCDASTCAGATCTDGERNGGEIGVDCGGGGCPQCGDGQACFDGLGCVSGFCKAGFCATPSCSDLAKNQNESDTDCGGVCEPCADGARCVSGLDCVSGSCMEDGICVAVPASCTDNERNGDETDVDCGGPLCPGCATNQLCDGPDDCLSATCIFGTCKDPTCDDGVRNQGETDQDCGGPCAGCEDGRACGKAGDCASNRCEASVCRSCEDRMRSGNESDEDCGGPCPACRDGDRCGDAGDCFGGGCVNDRCCTVNECGDCGAVPDEICNGDDDDCDGSTDEPAEIGAPPACPKQSGVCAGSDAECDGGNGGWVCDAARYAAHAATYEATEASCDALDNDCDGMTDEGLVNGCGACAPEPLEQCNGLDDDCDGDTDEIAACATCGDAASAVLIFDEDSDNGLRIRHTDWMQLDGDAAYFVARPFSENAGLVFRCAAGGACTSVTSSDIGGFGSVSLGVVGGVVHVGNIKLNAAQTLWINYDSIVDLASGELETRQIAAASNLVEAPIIMHASAGALYAAYLTSDAYAGTWSKLGDNAVWTPQGNFTVAEDRFFQFAVDSTGKGYIVHRAGAFPSTGYFRESGQNAASFCTDCAQLVLAIDPSDGVHAAYVVAGGAKVAFKSRVGTVWGAEAPIDDGAAVSLGFDLGGRAFIGYAKGKTELRLAVRDAAGTWTNRGVLTVPEAVAQITVSELGVDAAGRVHLGYVTHTGSFPNDHYVMRYVRVCAD